MIQNHLTSQPLSKRLKELGVPQESEYYWSVALPETGKSKAEVALLKDIEPMLTQQEWGEGFTSYSAFLSSELGEILPKRIVVKKGYSEVFYLYYAHNPLGEPMVIYERTTPTVKKLQMKTAKTEAEARGLMLEYLILNGLIKL